MAEPVTVGVLVTCLVDLFRPRVGFAAIKLLEDAGCRVSVPQVQTCCGQPAYNAGNRAAAQDVARRVIEAFAPFDYVVAPSGSCAGMLRKHYPALFADRPDLGAKANHLAARTHELVSFLTDMRGLTRVPAQFSGAVTYHDACSGLRELGVRDQPRRLLASVAGLELRECAEADVCCGFGGTFCVKYPEISVAMLDDKTADIAASGAGTVLAGDMGCLLNIAGRITRQGRPIRARHVAEVLAGMADGPAIGEAEGS